MIGWRRAAAFALAAVVGLAADPSPAQDLQATPLTPANVDALQLGGPDAIGGLGDYYLANDVVEAVVDHPSRRHGMLNHGGTLVDLGLRDRRDEDQLARIMPLVNLSQRVFVDYDAIRAEVDPKGAFARVVVTSDGLSTLPRGGGLARALDVLVPDEDALARVRVETVYEVRPGEPFVRLRTRFENRGDTPAPLFAYGDLWMRGGRSMRAFLGNAGAPELARGFRHVSFSRKAVLASIDALAPFSHVVMAGLPAYPPIAYALYSPTRAREGLSFFGVSGEHVNLCGSFLADPGWRELSALRLVEALRAELAPGASWEIERRVLVTGHADVASATDRILPSLAGELRSGVAGSVSPADVRTVIHVDDAHGHPVTQLASRDGRYRARLPAGTYRLTFRAEHRAPQVLQVGVREGELSRVPEVRWPGLGAVRFDRPEGPFADGGSGRIVFRGLDGTPDPVFDPELLGFAIDGRPMPSGTEIDAVAFVGNETDPLRVALPLGRYRLVATRGLEFEVQERVVELTEAAPVAMVEAFSLERVVQLPDHVSADFHVHSQASEDSGTTNDQRLRDFVAVGVQVLVATDHDHVPDYDEAIARLGLIGQIRVLRGVEVTSGTPSPEAPWTLGHQNAWPVAYQPWVHRGGAPPSQRMGAGDLFSLLRNEYRAQVVQLNHPRNARGTTDDGNFFSHQGSAGFPADPTLPLDDPVNRALLAPGADGTRPIDFDVIELMNGDSRGKYLATRDDFHWLLRQGHRRAATANSDTHGPHELAGLPRTYVRVGADYRDTRRLHEAVKAGRSFGTNGPLVVRFQVEGGRSGDTVTARGGRVRVDWEVAAPAWVPVGEVRLLVNGDPVRVLRATSGSSELSLRHDAFVTLEAGAPLDADPADWRERHRGLYTDVLAPGFLPTAFTNPVFVDVDGDGRFSAPGLPPPARPLAGAAAGLALVAAGSGVVATWTRRRRRHR